MTQLINQPPYVLTAKQVLVLGVTKIAMLIENLLQKVGIATLSGGSEGGKSFLSLFIAVYICGDYPDIFGLKINKVYGSVIIVCTEDTAEDICVRLSGFLNDKKIDPTKLRFIFETDNLHTKLKDELSRQPADLVIIDTLGDLFSGNLNDSITVRQFLKPYKKLATEHQCLFLFNHHIGKGKENNSAPSKNDVLGSQGIESASRTVLMLKKMPDSTRVLTVVKGNHIPEKYKNKGLVLNFDIQKGFQTTGETLSYDETNTSGTDETALEEEVVALYKKLKSYQKVSTTMRAKGLKVDKNKVGKIWRKHNPSIPPPIENDGRTEEVAKQNNLII